MALILAGIWVVSRAAPPAGNEPPAALKASVAALLFFRIRITHEGCFHD